MDRAGGYRPVVVFRPEVVSERLPFMPHQARGGGAEGAEGEAAALEVGELKVRSAWEDGFDEVGLGDADAEVVVGGP